MHATPPRLHRAPPRARQRRRLPRRPHLGGKPLSLAQIDAQLALLAALRSGPLSAKGVDLDVFMVSTPETAAWFGVSPSVAAAIWTTCIAEAMPVWLLGVVPAAKAMPRQVVLRQLAQYGTPIFPAFVLRRMRRAWILSSRG